MSASAPRSSDDSASDRGRATRERIVAEATLAFAAAGFNGVSVREIGARAGVNLATVHYHFGSKQALSEAVFERVARVESSVLTPAVAVLLDAAAGGSAGDLRTAIVDLFDRYIDFVAASPHVASLWGFRALATTAIADPLQRRYAVPLYRSLEEALRLAAHRGVVQPADYHLLLKTYIWTVYGYFTGGPLDRGSVAGEAGLVRLKAHVHTIVDRVLFDAAHMDPLLRPVGAPGQELGGEPAR